MNGIWAPSPGSVVKSWSSGEAGDNMGDTADRLSAARFSLPVPFVLAYLRGHFASGTGAADLDIMLDSIQSSRHDVSLETIKSVGTGADFNFWINPGEFHAWVFAAGDELVATWANPDAAMIWSLEAGLAPAT